MFCPKCGQKNDEDSKFCQDCGTALAAVQKEAIKTSNRKIVFISIITLISIIFLTIVISVIIRFLFHAPGRDLSYFETLLYERQTIKAKLTEVTNAMSNVASAVAAYRQEDDTWPNCATITEIRTSLGVSVGRVNYISSMSVTDGVITTIVSGIAGSVDGRGLVLHPELKKDGSIVWYWNGANGMPKAFIPKR